MTDAERVPALLRADMEFLPVGPSKHYAFSTSEEVEYVEVTTADSTLGYLWFSDSDGAADFVPARRAGGLAQNAGVAWSTALSHEHELGRTPREAVQSLAAGPGLGRYGTITTSRVLSGVSVEDLVHLARSQ